MSFTFKTLNLKKQSWIIILNTNDCMVKLTRDDAKTDNKQQQLAVSATPSETAICQCYHEEGFAVCLSSPIIVCATWTIVTDLVITNYFAEKNIQKNFQKEAKAAKSE